MSFKYSKEDLEEAVSKSTSFSGVLRELNAGTSGSSHQWIKNRIISLGIDYSHFTHRGQNSGSKTRKSPEEILVLLPDGARRPRRYHLLYAMLSKGLKYECAMDGCPSPKPVWRGKELPLEIDHIDGNWRNNLLNNLRFLCPNCHHQTETNRRGKAISAASIEEYEVALRELGMVPCPGCEGFMRKKSKTCHSCFVSPSFINTKEANKITVASAAKPSPNCPKCGKEKSLRSRLCRSCSNSKLDRNTKTSYPPVEELVDRVRASSFLAVGKELGVSDNAVRKYLRNRGVDVKSLTRTKTQ